MPSSGNPGSHSVYLVTGSREYRGHKPGTRFEARLNPAAEQRAIDRGAIQLLDRITPALPAGGFRLPDDWPPPGANTPATEGAERRPSNS